MKTLIFALFISGSAFAQDGKVLQTVNVDLDGDGKPDRVQIVSYGNPQESLEIQLSKSGQRAEFKNIVPAIGSGDESPCYSPTYNGLKSGKKSFLLSLVKGDFGGCNWVTIRELQVGMVGGVIQVLNLHDNHDEFHAGDPSPIENERYDFVRKIVSVDSSDHHDHSSVVPHASEKMEKGCDAALSLASFDKNGLPACLSVETFFMKQEIGAYNDELGNNACPILDGTFECTSKDGSQETLNVIRRQKGKVFSYDIRDYQNVLVANGKKYPVENLGSPRSFELTTCRRDTLSYHLRTYIDYEKGNPLKPIYDKFSAHKRDIIFKQDDLKARNFTITETNNYLKNDGSYELGDITVKTCIKKDSL